MTPQDVLQEWPPSRWDDYLAGFREGFTQGISRGQEIADAEAAARHRAAADVVGAMIRVPVVDRDEAAARRARWDARFAGMEPIGSSEGGAR